MNAVVTSLVQLVAVAGALGLGFVCGRARGRREGRRAERLRCLGLCDQVALQQHQSPNVGWVREAISTGSSKLEDPERFFGPRPVPMVRGLEL